MNNIHYSMVIQWSDEDRVFVVTVPELPGCRTHGETYEEAVKQLSELLDTRKIGLDLGSGNI